VHRDRVLSAGHPGAAHTLRYVERLLKFLLWQKGGCRVLVAGADEIAAALAQIYHPQGEHLVTGVDFFFGYRQTFAFTPFALKDVDFLGVSMKIPVDAELNLTENYGQWRLPDPYYLSHLESPSTMNKGGLPYMLTARLSALSALSTMNAQSGEKQAKSFKKLSKVLTLMREHQHRPGSMSQHLLDKLSCRLPLVLGLQPELCPAS
jgi:hypothetical protein